jgi:hypothetical protein
MSFDELVFRPKCFMRKCHLTKSCLMKSCLTKSCLTKSRLTKSCLTNWSSTISHYKLPTQLVHFNNFTDYGLLTLTRVSRISGSHVLMFAISVTKMSAHVRNFCVENVITFCTFFWRRLEQHYCDRHSQLYEQS